MVDTVLDHFRIFFDISASGMLATGQDGRILMANPALETLFGYAPGELIAQPLELLLPEQLHALALQQRDLDHNTPYICPPIRSIDLWGRHKQGRSFPIQMRLTTMHVDDQVLTVASVVTDSSAQCAAQEAGCANDMLNHAVLASLTAHIAVLDADGMIVAVNQSWERFARENGDPHLAHTCTGANYLDICRTAAAVGDTTAGQVLEGLVDVLSGAQADFTLEYACHHNGNENWFVMDVTMLENQRGIVVSHDTITERKRMEIALRASEERFRIIFDNTMIGFALVDLDGFLTATNPVFRRLSGYTAEELYHRPCISLIHPDEHAEGRDQFIELVQGRCEQYCVERRYIRNDGQTIWGRPSVSLVRDDSGVPSYVLVSIEDITSRKQAEAALQAQNTFVELLQVIAVAANQASSVEQALQTAIEKVCTCIGWSVGHVYLAHDDSPHELVSTDIWYMVDPIRFAVFRTITDAIGFAALGDLPGQVLVSGKPEWVVDMTALSNTPRTRLISDIGVCAGFAFPVLIGTEVVAVLEFFATEPQPPNLELLQVMTHVGTQLGRVIERTRVEVALRAAQAKYRALVEQIPAFVYTAAMNATGTTSYVSPQVESILGFTPEEWLANPQRWLEQVHPDDRAHALASIERVQTNDMPVPDEYRSFTRDGRLVWLQDTARAVRDEAGRPLFMQGITFDITERKRAEAALLEREAYFRALIEHSADAVALMATDGCLLYGSPATFRILGYTPQDFVGQNAFDLVHPDDRSQVAQQLTHIVDLPGATITIEARVRHVDGSWRDLEGRLTNLLDDPAVGAIVNNYRDITERKASDKALRRSERLYRTLASNFPNGAVFLFDRDLRFTIADGQILGAHGFLSENVQGKTLYETLSPEAWAVQEPLYRAALNGQKLMKETTFSGRTFDSYYLPVWNEQGEIFAGMLVSHDITDRKLAEQALIDERALLARRIEERTADLSAANAQLARTARLKDEFLASMSHELRTPLNAVLGLSEALCEEIYGPINDQQERALRTIEESGRHLLELINDILDLAKIGAGKLELTIEPVSVVAVCEASLRMVKQTAQTKCITVESSIDQTATSLFADARRLKQILVNLLSNAVKFTLDGGTIGLSVSVDAELNRISFAVRDTGIGIVSENMDRLFQPFIQLDSRLARQYEGTGLGLALVARMVEMHGGSISVHSTVGEGSTFTVSLPWQQALEPALTLVPQLAASATHSIRRALIIDDSPTYADQVSRYLGESGVTVELLDNGDHAITRAITLQPDLILLDILLPDMSGWDVLNRLKAEPRTRTIPVVIVSVVDERARALELGAAASLVKPCSRRDLRLLLEQLVTMGVADVHQQADPDRNAAPVILLAEDNEANITMIGDYLSTLGYKIVVTRNGAEAITRAHEIRPALILMDIQMPIMDGLEATRRIRADDTLQTVPIIALTALAMPGDYEKCIAVGANAYLSKPISLKKLAATIAMHLQPIA